MYIFRDFQTFLKIGSTMCLQGLPSQRDTSNSSILAYLNVIKTTSLIFSCTKHLHNSFCMHFDALWCVLMHSKHLEKILVIFAQKIEIFQIEISCSLQLQQSLPWVHREVLKSIPNNLESNMRLFQFFCRNLTSKM